MTRELTTLDVLTDLMGEEPFELAYLEGAASIILQRLIDAGFDVMAAGIPTKGRRTGHDHDIRRNTFSR